MIINGLRQRIHTGCHCYYCRKGRNHAVRRVFHRKVRHTQKRELQRHCDIITANMSIGYTD